MGYIYILINPSFPDYVKIGYADNVERRLKELNRSECIPFAFRIYATYEVSSRLSDLKIHSIIDKLNPELRSVESFDGKKRVREFYAMSPEDAYSILEAIAEINGNQNLLDKRKATASEQKDEEVAQEISEESRERTAPFAFSMCNISAGEQIEFWRGLNEPTDITCTVVDDKHVEYDGKILSLTALATHLLDAKWSVAGPRYFKYKGEWLNDIRHRLDC